MLLRSMPDLATATETFRQEFNARWGQENCVVLGYHHRADFGPRAHSLSIRAAWGGVENCEFGGRTVAVDDDGYLILNSGRSYSTTIRATQRVETLAVCFRP